MLDPVWKKLAALPETLRWIAGLLVATVVFWKLRIIDAAETRGVMTGSFDIYTEHYPMTKYGFAKLAAGELPLWNPYQLCGTPFLAVPHVGLLYPPNWIYAFVETAVATEISFVAHLLWAGVGTFLLGRTLGLPPLAAIASALTFMWSGRMIAFSNQASLISGMSWLPVTILMIEWTIRGRRFAWLGVVAAVTLQLLNGASEFFLQCMYVSAAYATLRLGQLTYTHSWPSASRRGVQLLGCVAAGVALAAPQLLASIELVSESARSGQALSFDQVRMFGTIGPVAFARQALLTTGMVTVGVLPLAGIALGPSTKLRPLWALALALAIATMLLVFGGDVYRAYYHTPFGDLFRRPNKFLHIYAFAQALMAGLAVLALQQRIALPRRVLWRQVTWGMCVAGLVVAIAWLAMRGSFNGYLLALLVALVLFGAVESNRWRAGLIVIVVTLQGANLFFGVKQSMVRPAAQPERFHRHDEFLLTLHELAGHDRVHIPHDILLLPSLMQKAGMLNDIRVTGDYQQLASQRAARFFERAGAVEHRRDEPFFGPLSLSARSNWGMMDLTGTRWYVGRPGTPFDGLMSRWSRTSGRAGVELRLAGNPRIYERTRALPRAYFSASARAVDTPEQVLDALQDPGFRPRAEVLLEGAPSIEAESPRLAVSARVEITEDAAERVVIDVDSREPGYVVLNDAYYPGWSARANGEAVEIYRANYLFRAMPVPAGRTRLELVYRSRPFERGLAISAGMALLVAGAVVWQWRRGLT